MKYNLADTEFKCKGIKLGPYNIDKIHVNNISKRHQYTEMFAEKKFVPSYDSLGIWSYDEEAHLVRRQRVPGMDQIGDIRIGWVVTPTPEGIEMAVIGQQKSTGDSSAILEPLS